MTPITDIGKFFVLAIAVIGLPLTMVLIAACVQKLEGPMLKLIYVLEFKCRCCESRLSNFCVKFIHLVILTLGFWTFIMIIPAFIFWFIESPEWDLMDASYFVFISVTTIGLGDLVPGDHPDNYYLQNLYRVCVSGKYYITLFSNIRVYNCKNVCKMYFHIIIFLFSVYLILSLVMVSLTGIAFYDIPQLNLGEHLSEHRDIYLSNSQLCSSENQLKEDGDKSESS